MNELKYSGDAVTDWVSPSLLSHSGMILHPHIVYMAADNQSDVLPWAELRELSLLSLDGSQLL